MITKDIFNIGHQRLLLDNAPYIISYIIIGFTITINSISAFIDSLKSVVDPFQLYNHLGLNHMSCL